MNKDKNQSDFLTEQESDNRLTKIIRILGIALVIILGMLVASGILFHGIIVQSIAP